jgi:hypothetical protein
VSPEIVADGELASAGFGRRVPGHLAERSQLINYCCLNGLQVTEV